MQWLYILLYAFLWLKIIKIKFLFSVNAYTFIPMVLFYG